MYLEIVVRVRARSARGRVRRTRWPSPRPGSSAGLRLWRRPSSLTFTRAGLISMAASLLFVGGLAAAAARHPRRAVRAIVGARGGRRRADVASSHSLESMRLRLTTETEAAWYRARIQAPAQRDARDRRVRDDSDDAHQHGPGGLGLRRRSAVSPLVPLAAGRRRSRRQLRRAPDDVRASRCRRAQTVSLEARVRAPMRPGEYRLMWDIVGGARLWFSTEPEARFVVLAARSSAVPRSGRPARCT